MSPFESPQSALSDEPACGAFEATVLLMDGELSGRARLDALAHASECLECGPLVRGWSPIAEHLEQGLNDATERAKPALFELPGHVLESIGEPPARPSLWARLKRQIPAFATFSTAAAMLFLLVPGRPTPVAPNVPVTRPVVAVAPRPASAAALPGASQNDCHMHSLAFDGADGMVYRTETDGMTVIWVHEHEGA